jgi:fucose 4-O-acetylase-like acetyltransferase
MANINAQRIDWIDQAKGIGILLVVIGHMNIPQELSKIIFSFHMPLFFFVSGYLYNEKKYSLNFKDVWQSKLRSLVWPFVTFTILYLIVSALTNAHSSIESIDYVRLIKGNRSPNTPLWFLTALFSTEVIFSQIIRFFSIKMAMSLILSMAVIGLVNAYYGHYSLILNLDIAFVTVLFFSVGWLVRKYSLDGSYVNHGITMVYILICLAVLILSSLTNQRIDIYENVYGNLFFMFLSVFCGVVSIVLISRQVLRIKVLSIVFKYLGQNSLIILGVHTLISLVVVSTFGQMLLRLDRILSLVLLFLSIEIISRYLPIILQLKGSKKSK